jgi:VanZ family protein
MYRKWGIFCSTMGISARNLLAFYLVAIFASLPFLPEIVGWARSRLGPAAVSLPLEALLVLCALLPALRLLRRPRPSPPWPHLAYLLLLLAALATLSTLASSPIGRIHLVEYGLLSILILRTLPPPRTAGSYFVAFAAAAAVGFADEIVQIAIPNRVFDWYDVGLNAAASFLGTVTAAWWRWTGPGDEALAKNSNRG